MKQSNPDKKIITCCVCKNVIQGERNRSDRICYDCFKEKMRKNYYKDKEKKIKQGKEYRIKNKKVIKEKRRIGYLEDREAILEKSKKYYSKNKYKALVSSKKYRKNNKEKILVKNKNRKNKLRSLSKKTDITNNYLATILKQSLKCPICNRKYSDKNNKHIDHIIPINVGGSHCKKNIRIICKNCNLTRPKDGSDIL